MQITAFHPRPQSPLEDRSDKDKEKEAEALRRAVFMSHTRYLCLYFAASERLTLLHVLLLFSTARFPLRGPIPCL